MTTRSHGGRLQEALERWFPKLYRVTLLRESNNSITYFLGIFFDPVKPERYSGRISDCSYSNPYRFDPRSVPPPDPPTVLSSDSHERCEPTAGDGQKLGIRPFKRDEPAHPSTIIAVACRGDEQKAKQKDRLPEVIFFQM